MTDDNTEAADEVEVNEEPAKPASSKDPVKRWTKIVLGTCVVLMLYYVIADRLTPVTSQARVHALVVPIAPEVSGTVIEVAVKSNSLVEKGDVLFRIDPERYAYAVESAEANLKSARQATGASTANVTAAEAQVASARANLVKNEQDLMRMRRIRDEDPGAISERRVELAEASYLVAQGQLDAANANLAAARETLGEAGDANFRVLEAMTALENAQLNLDRTVVRAPERGVVTDVRVDIGNFAGAGAPQMTFIAMHNIWVQADFTENNLGNIKPGDQVSLVFDALPGHVLKGSIRNTGFGVMVDSEPLGSLPTIENDNNWLRSAQRFSVQVDFDLPNAQDRRGLRVGAQATVVVFTDRGWLFNTIARIRMRLVSWFTYLY